MTLFSKRLVFSLLLLGLCVMPVLATLGGLHHAYFREVA